MNRQHSWLLAAAVFVALLIAAVPNAGAARLSAPMHDGRFYSGHGPAFYGPFALLGGSYSVDVWAHENPIYDPNDDGCIFGAYIDGIESPTHLTLSTPLRISSFPPWHYTPTVTFPAGHYKLLVLPGSDCDWSVSILRLGAAVPGINVVAVSSYLHQGTTFTATSVAHWGQTINFAIFYTLQGVASGTPAGTLTLAQHGKNLVSFPLHPRKDADGTQQLYTNLIFPRALAEKEGFTLGSVTATFSITVGTFHARRSLDFTLAN